MASNVSSVRWGAVQYSLSAILLFERCAMTVSNGLLLSVLLHHRVLRQRKQYLIVASAALSDMLYGLTGAATSIEQLYEQLNLQSGLILSSECPVQLKIFNQAAIVGQQLALLAQCMDRVLAVSKPFYYFSLTPRYAKKMLLAIYGNVFIYWLIAQVGHAVMPVVWVPSCIASVTVHWLVWLLFVLLMALPSVGVLCMQPVLYIEYKRSFNKTSGTSTSSRQQQHYLVQQRKLTVTVALTAVTALFTVLVPATFLLPLVLFVMPKGGLPGVGLMMLVFYNIGPIASLAIYCARQREVRVGLKKMFNGQQLPNNFETQYRSGLGAQRK